MTTPKKVRQNGCKSFSIILAEKMGLLPRKQPRDSAYAWRSTQATNERGRRWPAKTAKPYRAALYGCGAWPSPAEQGGGSLGVGAQSMHYPRCEARDSHRIEHPKQCLFTTYSMAMLHPARLVAQTLGGASIADYMLNRHGDTENA